jgi:hypothetical protein
MSHICPFNMGRFRLDRVCTKHVVERMDEKILIKETYKVDMDGNAGEDLGERDLTRSCDLDLLRASESTLSR